MLAPASDGSVPPKRALPVSLCVVLALLAGCATSPPPPSQPVLWEDERRLGPDRFVEVNLEMNESASVTARYQADAAVAWDVHSHEQGQIRLHDEGESAEGTITFEAPNAGTFSILWENRGEDAVDLSVTVQGDATVDSITP